MRSLLSVMLILVFSSIVMAQPPWLKKGKPGIGPQNIDQRIERLEKQLEMLKKIKDGTFKPGEMRGTRGPQHPGFRGVPGNRGKGQVWGHRGNFGQKQWQGKGPGPWAKGQFKGRKPEKNIKNNE